MGYNNNHSGMHMIWHRRYAAYDDLKYYDELVRQNTAKASNAKKTGVVQNQIVNKVTQTDSDEKAAKMEKNADNKIELSRCTDSKQANAFENDIAANKTAAMGSATEEMTNDKETRHIIDLEEHYKFAEVVMANIMMIAIRDKTDVYSCLYECEEAMAKDTRMHTKSDFESPPPIMDAAFIFLSLLAEKMHCSIHEFFIDDPKRRQVFVYDLIDHIEKSYIRDSIVKYDDDDNYFEIDSYEFTGDTQTEDPVYPPWKVPCMKLEFHKFEDDNGKLSYGIVFGDWYRTGAYADNAAALWEETSGKLCDFFEEIISTYPKRR